jgi:hypothetical protein
MKTSHIIGLGALALAGVNLYFSHFKDNENDFISDFIGGSSSSGSSSNDLVAPTYGASNLDDSEEKETKTKKEINSTDKKTKDDNFKLRIYKDDYKKSSSNGSYSRKYVQNDDLDFTVVKEDNKNVGGFDFKQKQTITKKQANLLEKNKDNPILGITRRVF